MLMLSEDHIMMDRKQRELDSKAGSQDLAPRTCLDIYLIWMHPH